MILTIIGSIIAVIVIGILILLFIDVRKKMKAYMKYMALSQKIKNKPKQTEAEKAAWEKGLKEFLMNAKKEYDSTTIPKEDKNG